MPIKSDRPDIELSPLGLYDYVFGDLTTEEEDRVAVIDIADGSETTFAQLQNYIESTAGWLVSKGIKKGDVVALHLPNSLNFIVAAYGLWRIGAVVSPLSLLSTPETVTAQIEDSGAKMLLTVAALGDASSQGAKDAGIAEEDIIHLDTSKGMQQIMAERRTAPEVEINPDEDLAVLPYSSGTTGLPKGVRLMHRQLVANVQQGQDIELLRRDDTVYAVLPFFHIYGLTALVNLALAQRAKLVVVPRFELQSFLEHHQKFEVNFTLIAPPIAVQLAKHPMVENYDLSRMRGVFSGAATLDEDLALALEKRLGIHVQQGYGMTETSPRVHANVSKDINRGSIGKPCANTESKLVDPETLEEIPLPSEGVSEVGELWVRGPQIMAGYLNKPEQTAEALPGDGWLRTGDLANSDPEGNVHIVDRLKELIKYKGYQVPPAELESVLLSHPEIADAAVIGVHRASDGEELPKAFVVAQRGSSLNEQQVMDFVAERVASYKKIRIVEFVQGIPKSSTGKILRRELRERERSA